MRSLIKAAFHSLIFIALLFSCRDNELLPIPISSQGKEAESVYLTHNENGDAVVAWTEKEGNSIRFLLSVVEVDAGVNLSPPMQIPIPQDISTHAEGMPKIAYKNDGTIVAAYETKAPTKDNKYAGAIYFTQSSDGGKTWSTPAFIHSDTTTGKSRSFFDIARLPDDEIGASWLDIRVQKKKGGRSVKFARTSGDAGFSSEVLVDSSACECCRIDILSEEETIRIAYRGSGSGPIGQTIRDMMYVASKDEGRSFTSPRKISDDNWVIDGCPHTGPSLSTSNGVAHAMWYTEGGSTGVFYANASSQGFTERESISIQGRHPQIAANQNRLALVWEETHGSGKNGVNIIKYQLRDNQKIDNFVLSSDPTNAYFPVVTGSGAGFIIAYLADTNGVMRAYVQRIN